MHARPIILLSSIALLLHGASLAAADKILLRQHWEPGKVYHFETNQDMEMTVPGLPGDGGQTTSIIQQMDVTVRKDAGTDKKLAEMKFTAIKAMMNMGGQLMTYDSTDPAMSQPMLQQAFGSLMGKSVTLVYDKNDAFVEARVPDGLIATPLGQDLGPDGRQMGELFRQSLEHALPAEPVAIGDAFTRENKTELPPMGSIVTKTKGRFDAIVEHEGRKHAKLVVEGTIETPAGANQAIVLGASKLTGEILFDLVRKVVSRNTMRTELKLTLAGKEVPMKQTVITTLKGIEDAK